MNTKSTSISTLVIITLVAVTTILLASLGTVNYISERNGEMEDLRSRSTGMTNQLSVALELPLWNFDREQVEKIVDSTTVNRNVAATKLQFDDSSSPAGKTIVGIARDAKWSTVRTDHVVPPQDSFAITHSVRYGGQDIGTVTVYFTPRFVEAGLRQRLFMLFLGILFVDIILVITVYRLLSSIAIRPLQHIEQYAAAVSTGDRSVRQEERSFLGELQSLCTSIHKMVDLLDARYDAIRKNQAMLETILNSVPQSIFWKDLDGVYQGGNGKFLASTGLETIDDVVGKTDFDLPWPEEETRVYRHEDEEVIRTRQTLRHVVRYRQNGGNGIWVEVTKVPLLDGAGPYGVLGVYEDVTERREADEALRNYKEHLEELVEQRTSELTDARNLAEAANRAKSVFLANMSHELRTPLNAVLGFSHLMRTDENVTYAQRETLEIIERSGEHLLALINDVLDVARIESGRVEVESAPFDLGNLIRDITDMMSVRADEKRLTLEFDQSSHFPRFVRSDSSKVRQILINLINNAIKFTERGSVTLRLDSEQGEADGNEVRLVFEVEDTGVGIAPEHLDHIFEPFIQVGAQNANKGTGLGLTITRQYTELLGGSLTVESAVGQGSKFRAVIAVQPADQADVMTVEIPRGRITALAPGQPSYKILIIEDQMENSLLLERMLTEVGFNVRIAENGIAGVAAFESWQPHLIWLDRRMPEMDGLEAAQRIRALPGGQNVKIVGLTASAFAEQRNEALAAGMDDFIRKPFRAEEIFDCMARLLGVEYQYQEHGVKNGSETPAAVAPSPSALTDLPADLKNDLQAAVVSLDIEKIQAAIDRITNVDPALAAMLTQYADRFAFTPILDMLQKSST